MFLLAAQYDAPAVTAICEGIDAAAYGDDILSRIYAGAVAFYGNSTCHVNPNKYTDTEAETFDGWGWQKCTEMVMPIGIGSSSMFQPNPFNFTTFAEKCKKDFGVSPRPHWITSYYGGHDMKLVLQKFGSNIIFSNGLKDPWSSGGVLYDLSDSLVALPTINGTHCQDLMLATETDPAWLVHQRKQEVEIIQGWITQYYADIA